VLALQVDGMVPAGPRQEHGYSNFGRMVKLEGAEELGYGVSSPAQNAALVAEAQVTLSAVQRCLKFVPTFLDRIGELYRGEMSSSRRTTCCGEGFAYR
jgi:hypothetical protein